MCCTISAGGSCDRTLGHKACFCCHCAPVLVLALTVLLPYAVVPGAVGGCRGGYRLGQDARHTQDRPGALLPQQDLGPPLHWNWTCTGRRPLGLPIRHSASTQGGSTHKKSLPLPATATTTACHCHCPCHRLCHFLRPPRSTPRQASSVNPLLLMVLPSPSLPRRPDKNTKCP